jgi:hypothetical protein
MSCATSGVGSRARISRPRGESAAPPAVLHPQLDRSTHLGRGQCPPALSLADLGHALEEMARRSPVPTTVDITGDLRALTEELLACSPASR